MYPCERGHELIGAVSTVWTFTSAWPVLVSVLPSAGGARAGLAHPTASTRTRPSSGTRTDSRALSDKYVVVVKEWKRNEWKLLHDNQHFSVSEGFGLAESRICTLKKSKHWTCGLSMERPGLLIERVYDHMYNGGFTRVNVPLNHCVINLCVFSCCYLSIVMMMLVPFRCDYTNMTCTMQGVPFFRTCVLTHLKTWLGMRPPVHS